MALVLKEKVDVEQWLLKVRGELLYKTVSDKDDEKILKQELVERFGKI